MTQHTDEDVDGLDEELDEAVDEAPARRGLPPRALPILGTLAAVVLIFSAYVVGVVTTRVTTPGDASPEAGFARDMMTHHAQAVEMAMIAWQRGQADEVKVAAYDIATNQSDQIGSMRDWLFQWKLDPTGSEPAMAWMPDAPPLTAGGLMPGMATRAEIDKLYTLTGKDFDILFCQLMLRHHLGGIHMADAILDLTDDRIVVELATKIKNAQTREVHEFEVLLARFGAKPL